MKKTLTVSILGIAVLALAATVSIDTVRAAESLSRSYLHSYNLPSTGIAIEGYCPVAYQQENRPVRGSAEFASLYNGVTYHLSSADAKVAFDNDPEMYVPAFGGWCAYGMAVQDKFPVDPTNFKIVDGRLMLFLRNVNVDALEKWNQGDEQEQVEKAENHWKKVQG